MLETDCAPATAKAPALQSSTGARTTGNGLFVARRFLIMPCQAKTCDQPTTNNR